MLALIMLLSVLGVGGFMPTAVAESGPIDQAIVQGGAILHCFDWSYNEIKANLEDIAAAGYVAVQTSPVQPAKDYNGSWTDTGGNWWKLYQPLGFRVADGGETWLGSKEELQSLCAEADRYGIKVIVDVVANHVANKSGGGYTISGTYNVSDQVDDELQDSDGSKGYYHTSENGTNDGSRYNMTQYHLSMPDLNTGNAEVQQMVLDFLKECVDCGVDGFRFDAAKHIELPGDSGCGSNFWPFVLGGVRDYAGANNLFIYGESLSGSGSDAWVNEFITYMALTDSQTGNAARDAVRDQNAGALAVGTYSRGDYPQDYVLWAESHDTYEDGGSTGVSSDKIVRTWAIVGARAHSTALYLARPNERMGLASSDTSWKSTAVAEVNKFKTHYVGTGEYLSYDQNAKITWIERGNANNGAGVVISKLDGAGWVELTAHLMSDGIYKDEVTGSIFAVTNGKITGYVGATGVAVVYKTTDAEPPTPPTTSSQMLYLTPASNWMNDDARFAVYTFGGDEHWYSMSLVDGETNVYSAEITNSYTNVIFCRMDPALTDNNWSNKWNQTADLTVPSDKNWYKVTDGTWDSGGGTWDVYGTIGGGTNPVEVTEDAGYYLVGTMTGWGILPEYKLTQNTDAGATEYYINDVQLTRTSSFSSEFKIVYSPDGVTAETWYPDGMGNNYGDQSNSSYKNEIPQSGIYNIRFRPDKDGGSDWHVNCIKAERSKYFVMVNDADKNGTVTVDKEIAAAGETVTVTVTPNEYYELDTLVYMCEDGISGTFITHAISETTFTMPSNNAVVKATFKHSDCKVEFIADYEDYLLYNTSGEVITATYGATITPPEEPTRDGYIFGGWYEQDWEHYDWWAEVVEYVTVSEGETLYLGDLLNHWEESGAETYFRPWDFENDTVTEPWTALYAKWTKNTAVPSFASHSLVLSGQIGVNFFMDLSMLSDAEKEASYMTFEISGRGSVSAERVPFNANQTNAAGTRYGFTCYVNAIQMGDKITATFHYGDGQTVTETYSVMRYMTSFRFNARNSSFDETTVELIDALADYGHYVQLFMSDAKDFTLGEGDDAYLPMDRYYAESYDHTAIASALESGHAVDRNNSDPNLNGVPSYALVLDSETAILVYVRPADGYTDTPTVTLDGAEYTPVLQGDDGCYEIEIANISAHELGDTHNVTVTTDNSDANAYINVSVMSYIYGVLTASEYADNTNAKNGVASLYAYWQAATAYKAEH